MVSYLAILLVFVSNIFGACGAFLLKKGAPKFNLNPFKQLKNYHFIGGGVCYTAGLLLYMYALSLEKLPILFPITSFTYIWIMLLSYKFLGEEITRKKIVGTALIFAGIYFLII